MLSLLSNWTSRLLAIAGLVGIVLFFPIVICHQHTSLFEHLTTDCQSRGAMDNPSSTELLRHYLVPYGILWWLSIVMTMLTIVYMVRQHERDKVQIRSLQIL
jgi:hypothetical protein